MKNDTEFYRAEYEKCRVLYMNCPPKRARHKKLYRHLTLSMFTAYTEARKELSR